MTFFDELLNSFCAEAGVDYALVAKSQRDHPGYFRILACSNGSAALGSQSFEIAGSLFETVIAKGEFVADAGAQGRFPNDGVLKHFNAQACVGLVVQARNGDGVIAVLHESAMAAPEVIKGRLKKFAARPSFNLEI